MVPDFEITRDREFLSHFWDCRDISKLSPEMVERLRQSEDPYGKYGYGQWLYRLQPEGEKSLIEAFKCFKYASDNGVADALQMISRMSYFGEMYSERSGKIEGACRSLSHVLNAGAIASGSEFAKIHRNFDLFNGRFLLPADKEAAIAEAQEEADRPGASLLWREQLGWHYESQGRVEEAIKAYEECIAGGLYHPLYDLAFLYLLELKNAERYEELMQEGIRRGVSACRVLGIEKESEWESLSPEEQERIHTQLKQNLEIGIQQQSACCIYLLAYLYTLGKCGFERSVEEGLKLALQGVKFHNSDCCELIIYILEDSELRALLPEELVLSEEELLMVKLRALRFGAESLLDEVIEHSEEYAEMGYKEEITSIWRPLWEEKQKEKEEEKENNDEEEEEATELPTPIVKTEIVPTVLVIHPSGFTDFVEADLYPMSLREMGELIDADGVDSVHFSNPLTQITKSCNLPMQLTMYADRNGQAKGLEDNPVATMLYGHAYEIRGSVIIAMEDRKYDVYSFHTEEDIEAVFEAIFEFSGGLIRRDTGEEEGRYHPWA